MATWIVSGALLLIVGAIIANMIKEKRAGKGGCSCGCDCGSCSGNCHH